MLHNFHRVPPNIIQYRPHLAPIPQWDSGEDHSLRDVKFQLGEPLKLVEGNFHPTQVLCDAFRPSCCVISVHPGVVHSLLLEHRVEHIHYDQEKQGGKRASLFDT